MGYNPAILPPNEIKFDDVMYAMMNYLMRAHEDLFELQLIVDKEDNGNNCFQNDLMPALILTEAMNDRVTIIHFRRIILQFKKS